MVLFGHIKGLDSHATITYEATRLLEEVRSEG